MNKLQELREADVVEEYGITETSLEDVFLGVTRESGFRYDQVGKRDVEVEELLQAGATDDMFSKSKQEEMAPMQKKEPPAVDGAHHEERKRRPRPFAALMNKNIVLQRRQWGTNLCQVTTPLLVLGIMLILKLVVISQFGDQINQRIVTPTIPFVMNASPDMWDRLQALIGPLIGQFGGGGGFGSFSTRDDFDFKRDVMGGYRADKFIARMLLGMDRSSVVEEAPAASARVQKEEEEEKEAVERAASLAAVDPSLVSNQLLLFFLVSGGDDFLGSRGADWRTRHFGNNSGMLGRTVTWNISLTNMTSMEVPYFLPRSSFEAMQDEVMADFGDLNAAGINQVKHELKYVTMTPDGIVAFERASADTGSTIRIR